MYHNRNFFIRQFLVQNYTFLYGSEFIETSTVTVNNLAKIRIDIASFRNFQIIT